MTKDAIGRSLSRSEAGFTLIEALMTVAIIGIMAALVISAFSSASSDSNRIVARQQQAALQAAVMSWVNGDANRVDVINATTGDGKMRTIAEIQTNYNSVLTSLARMNLVSGYMDSTTASMFVTYTTNSSKIATGALNSINQHLEMPNWVTGSYPQVNMVSN